MDIPKLLDTIKTTSDIQVQFNLLTSLCPVFRPKVRCDEVVTSRIVYETAHSILSHGMGDDTVRVLSFLTCLLRATSLAASSDAARRARELLRVSGCLQDMNSMFLGTMMMYEETWKALCDCIVESCKECEDNQNYCSRLIPTCIQRCNVRNSEIIKVLKSLLMNNARNIQIFVDTNGLSIFTRETLQDRPTMELLNTVVQNKAAANLLKHNTDLLRFLLTLEEHEQEPRDPRMLEWSCIILMNIASRIEGVEMSNSAERDINISNIDATGATGTDSSDFTVSFLLKENWDNVKNNLDDNLKVIDCIASSDERKSFHINSIDLLTGNFTPNCVSTPKKAKTTKGSMIPETYKKHKSTEMHQKINSNKRPPRANNTAPVIRQKLSTSSRLCNIVNNSVVLLYKTVENIFLNNPIRARAQKDTKKRNLELNNPVSSTKILQPGDVKLKSYKDIVKKLKTGIYIYGCNFKKISQTMWPQEKKMTPQVLYRIYRKYIVKQRNRKITRI